MRSPQTNERLAHGNLVPNHNLRGMILEAIEKARKAVEAAESRSSGDRAVLLATCGKRQRAGCANGEDEQQEAEINEQDASNLGWTPHSRVSGPMPARRDVRRNGGGDVGRLEGMGGQGGSALTRPMGRWMGRAPVPASSRARVAGIDATLDGLADGELANPVANGWESRRIDANARSEQSVDVEIADLDHVIYTEEILQVSLVMPG